MKSLTLCALLLVPALAFAQTPQSKAAKAPAKTVTKTVAKATPKAATKKTVAVNSKTSKLKNPISPAAVATSTAALAATNAALGSELSPEQTQTAQLVHTGRIACELGAFVNVDADDKNPGHFYVHGKGFRYHMTPVASRTGSVRLEDVKAGAVWLQIANKSMLMDQKRGQRLADECMSVAQTEVAQAIKLNPPKSLLEPAQ